MMTDQDTKTNETTQNSESRDRTAPEPEDPRKPDGVTEIRKPSWWYIVKKTGREFSEDQATDLAAALTYYAVLAIFPAMLAFVSLIGLFGDAGATTRSLLDLAAGVVPESTLDAVRGMIDNLASSPASGWTFVIGVVGALWSASGYVTAFSRAMNRIYEIDEGRPFWKLRPVTLGVTVLAIVVAVVAAVLVVASSRVARQIGEALGVGDAVLVVWDIVRWVLLAFLAVLIVAVLYYATPNVKQPKFRWMSVGAFVALIVWALASVGFAFYASNFASYNATYGSIGGIIVFLLWVWISNLALLFGAELDAEVERGRELQAGIAAEEAIQLPPRDSSRSEKKEEKAREDLAEARRLRGAPDDEVKAALESPEDRAKEQHDAEGDARKNFDKTAKRLRQANKKQAARLRSNNK
jgi:membrane protein